MIFKSPYGNKQTCKVIKMWELSVQTFWWNIQVKRAVTHLNQRLSMACNCSSDIWTMNKKLLILVRMFYLLFTVKVAIHVSWLVGGDHWIHALMMTLAKFGSNWPSVFMREYLLIMFGVIRPNFHVLQKQV
jgi:hypothetical protein